MNPLARRKRLPMVMVAALAAMALATGCGTNEATSEQPADGRSGHDSPHPVSSSTIDPQQPSEPTGAGSASAQPPDQGVFGRITHRGSPLAGAMIQPDPGPGNTAPLRDSFASSAADGSYGVGLSPGKWAITISAGGFEPVTVHVTVPTDGAVEADVALTRAQ